MNWVAVAVSGLVGAVVAFFWHGNRKTAQAHAKFTATDVAAALDEVISPDSCCHDGWDLFLSWPIDDDYLESIRQRCLAICRDDPRVPGRDLSEEAEAQVKLLLEELRSRGA
jgi:hypothetical protein